MISLFFLVCLCYIILEGPKIIGYSLYFYGSDYFLKKEGFILNLIAYLYSCRQNHNDFGDYQKNE